MVRRYPEIDGPAVLLLFCLAPHGVFPATRITSRAVSSYLAFSPLPAPFSKNRRYLFCDTFRRRNLTNATPAFFTRHAAVWCSDFPLTSLTTRQRSSAIRNSLTQPGNPRNLELNRGFRDSLRRSSRATIEGSRYVTFKITPRDPSIVAGDDTDMLGFISSPDLERLRFQTNARERTFSPSARTFSRAQ